ncbi:hypothetical protein Hdeb2414_s0019g00542751 [Helianthus debilis subsp. tardiflorus]
MGFFSFAFSVKKISISPPKSFHEWKMKFLFIRAEVIPMAMQFRAMGPIAKEDMMIPLSATCYENLMALSNRVFGEQVLVAAVMSDKWPEDNESVSVFLLNDEETALYQSAFPTFAGVMGTRPLRDGEEFWLEQIHPNFMYARIEAFAAYPLATEVALIPNPKPCRAITSVGKEIVYLSSEESVASSERELNPSHDLFAGVLHNLVVNPDEKTPKMVSKKKTTTARGATIKKTEVAGTTSDAESQKGTDTSAAPIVEEPEEDRDPEVLIWKNAAKRSREETRTETPPGAKKVAIGKPIGKKGSLRSHYYEVSPGLGDSGD